MKYGRTLNTIFEIVDETELVYHVKAKGNPHNIYSKSKCQGEIIKIADTIQDLCDEFVVFYKNGIITFATYDAIIDDIHTFDEIKEIVDKIYGAIFTDKGLIYVVRMNDKGELELL